MEHVRLPSTTQHKRKASASEFLQDCDPKTARSREAEGLGLEHGQPQQETDDGDKEEPQALILTETSSMHLAQLRQSQEELVAKIDEITGGRRHLAALGWFLMGKSAAVMEQSVASLVLHHKIREKASGKGTAPSLLLCLNPSFLVRPSPQRWGWPCLSACGQGSWRRWRV